MTLREIRRKADAEADILTIKIGEIRQNERNDMIDWLRSNGLDNVVVRVRDGKKGYLRIVLERYNSTPRLCFYPITKSGEASKNQSGWIPSWVRDEELLQDYIRYEVPNED